MQPLNISITTPSPVQNEVKETTLTSKPLNPISRVNQIQAIAFLGVLTYANNYTRFLIDNVGKECAEVIGGCYLLNKCVHKLSACYSQEGISWKNLGLGLLAGGLGAFALYDAWSGLKTFPSSPQLKALACVDNAPFKDWLPGSCKDYPLITENMKVAFKHGAVSARSTHDSRNAAVIEAQPETDQNGFLSIPSSLINSIYHSYTTFGATITKDSTFCKTLTDLAGDEKLDLVILSGHGDPGGITTNMNWLPSGVSSSRDLECLDKVLKPNARIILNACETAGSSWWNLTPIWGNIADTFAASAPGRTVYASPEPVSSGLTFATHDSQGIVPHFASPKTLTDVTSVIGPGQKTFERASQISTLAQVAYSNAWTGIQMISQVFTFSQGSLGALLGKWGF